MLKYLIGIIMMCILSFGCTSVVDRVEAQGEALIESYVAEFNSSDDEIYIQEYPNAVAADFMKDNIPIFECPDKNLEKIWYFRWWTYRKHIKNTSDGYIITEFLPDVPWAGLHNAISCPVMHQFAEGRWLNTPSFLNDYAAFWCDQKKGVTKYSCPLSYAVLEYYKVKQDQTLITALYQSLKEIYMSWYDKRWDSVAGMFWQIDGHDGMEKSISGKMAHDASGYRVTINSYMYADASALAEMAKICGNVDDYNYFSGEAAKIKDIINSRLWDEDDRFYKVIPRHRDMSFSYVRELHGYVPWMFGIPDQERSDAWSHLSDSLGFKAPYGPTTAEQRADDFEISYVGHDCKWNGPSWPFATSQTLTALSRFLHANGENEYATKHLYLETLITYADSHRMVSEDGNNVCWIDENINPYTGEWLARKIIMGKDDNKKIYERGKDYNHSTFCDLIISGLIGIQPQLDGSVIIQPLVPEGEWDWFFLSGVHCAGKEISVIYDRTGKKYGGDSGMSVYVNGERIACVSSYTESVIVQ